MNIIHLLSQNHLTGAEVYAVTLAQKQIEQHHQVYQVSNGFFTPSPAPQFKLEVETRSHFTFFKNVLWLRNFIKKNNIQIVHSHSRAAAKLAFYGTLFSRTAHVSTVHGVQHTSISKKLLNQYGQALISVCENIKTHLIEDFSYNPRRIHTIPNPISSSSFQFFEKKSSSGERLKVAIVGRTTGPKATRTELVIQALISQKADVEIFILGGHLAQLNLSSEQKKSVQEVSSPQLTGADYSKYDLIVGSGRVCMEALITGVPCIAFGEALYFGLVTEANFSRAFESNFGDIKKGSLTPSLNPADLTAALKQLKTIDLKKLSQMASDFFNVELVTRRVVRLYESAYFLKNYSKWIPILMYHKIPAAPIESQHKIFVTKSKFEDHLKFFKSMGFTTLTFSELALYRKGLLSFKSFPKKPLVLTFDDGYQDNLDNASPLLTKYGYRAQIFLLADQNVNSNNWDASSTEPSHEIIANDQRRLWKTSAFEIGSHGFSHQKITEMSSQQAMSELRDSKIKLQKEFETEVNCFAFTYGITDKDAKTAAQTAGYDYALNTDTGGLIMEEDPYAIFRVSIFPDENWWSLFKKTSKWYRRYYFNKRGK
ncbi:MAG: polysaccharide deacetylase family protein [Pseudobdellovibrio sp.]